MVITVGNVSKNGKGVVDQNDKWHNVDKNSKGLSFTELRRGQEVELIKNDDGYVIGYKVLGTSKPEAKQPLGKANNDAMVRSVALKAVFPAVYTAISKEASHEEALARAMESVKAVIPFLNDEPF